MKSKIIEITEEKPFTVEGFMTFQKTEEGMTIADFQCCEDIRMTPVKGTFDVQLMRDGNVYFEEIPNDQTTKQPND